MNRDPLPNTSFMAALQQLSGPFCLSAFLDHGSRIVMQGCFTAPILAWTCHLLPVQSSTYFLWSNSSRWSAERSTLNARKHQYTQPEL